MKKIYKLLLIVVLILKASTCYANLGINPFYIVLDANSKNRNAQAFITNTTKEAKTYRIKLINYKQLKDGSYQEISQPENGIEFAAPYLVLSPNQTTLKPGESQTVRIQRKPMSGAKDGEYVSHLMVQEVDIKAPKKSENNVDGLKIEARALYAITIPVIIQKGALKAGGDIVKASVVKNNDKYLLNLEIKRAGTKSLFVNAVVKNNKTGDEAGRLNKVRVYLSTNSREVSIPLEKYNGKDNLKVELTDVDSGKEIAARVLP